MSHEEGTGRKRSETQLSGAGEEQAGVRSRPVGLLWRPPRLVFENSLYHRQALNLCSSYCSPPSSSNFELLPTELYSQAGQFVFFEVWGYQRFLRRVFWIIVTVTNVH
jgi:hypothetical protein